MLSHVFRAYNYSFSWIITTSLSVSNEAWPVVYVSRFVWPFIWLPSRFSEEISDSEGEDKESGDLESG